MSLLQSPLSCERGFGMLATSGALQSDGEGVLAAFNHLLLVHFYNNRYLHPLTRIRKLRFSQLRLTPSPTREREIKFYPSNHSTWTPVSHPCLCKP